MRKQGLTGSNSGVEPYNCKTLTVNWFMCIIRLFCKQTIGKDHLLKTHLQQPLLHNTLEEVHSVWEATYSKNPHDVSCPIKHNCMAWPFDLSIWLHLTHSERRRDAGSVGPRRCPLIIQCSAVVLFIGQSCNRCVGGWRRSCRRGWMIRRAAVYMGNRLSDAHDRDGRSVFLCLISENSWFFTSQRWG